MTAETARADAGCAVCGRAAEIDGSHPLDWSAEIVQTGPVKQTRWVCPDCTRTNVRAIEAKLDQEWW